MASLRVSTDRIEESGSQLTRIADEMAHVVFAPLADAPAVSPAAAELAAAVAQANGEIRQTAGEIGTASRELGASMRIAAATYREVDAALAGAAG